MRLWHHVRYLLVTLPAAVATMVFLPLLAAGLLSTGAGGLGFVVVPRLMAGLRRWAEWHRRRAAALLGVTITPRDTRMLRGVRQVWEDRENRRDLRWSLRHVATGVPAGLAALMLVGQVVNPLVEAPLWWLFPADDPLRLFAVVPVTGWAGAIGLGAAQIAVVTPLAVWAVPRMARLHARGCLAALEPSPAEQLAERVGELTESRAGVLDAHAAELRRIERDLHDGTQARLVAIAMRLGVAREVLSEEDGLLARLLREAHEATEEAMTELREVIRTMYPPILADRGLAGALAAVAAGAGVPVEVRLDDLGRLPAAVEAAAYFIVAEAVTNVTKHSGAATATVRLTRRDDVLTIEATDDGHGGVDESRGTGVAGIRKRTAALDGLVRVHSPAGGPTVITVELPCAS